MPPKAKFTREQIVAVGYEIVRNEGEKAFTARELGKRLGTSSSPVFTVFNDMEELKQDVKLKAKQTFDEYMKVADEYNPAYKMRGLQWIKFAQNEPKLFEMMFMQPNNGKNIFDDVLSMERFGKECDIEIIKRDYNATTEQAEHLFRQLWTYTYGLCVLCSKGDCSFSDEEISDMLSEIFVGMIFVLTHYDEKLHLSVARKDSEEGKRILDDYPRFLKQEKTEDK